MRRLEELLRQMCQASKAIGNTELENKFAEGENQALLKAAMSWAGFKFFFLKHRQLKETLTLSGVCVCVCVWGGGGRGGIAVSGQFCAEVFA